MANVIATRSSSFDATNERVGRDMLSDWFHGFRVEEIDIALSSHRNFDTSWSRHAPLA